MQLIEQLAARIRLTLHHLGQRGHFGPNGRRFALSRRTGRTGLGFAILHSRARLFGSGQRLISGFGHGDGLGLALVRQRHRLRRVGQRGFGGAYSFGGAGGFGLGLVHGGAAVGQEPLRRLVAGGKPGGIFGCGGQHLLAVGQDA